MHGIASINDKANVLLIKKINLTVTDKKWAWNNNEQYFSGQLYEHDALGMQHI